MPIHYKCGYKYQLTRDYQVQTSITPQAIIKTPYIHLDYKGLLWISEGYAWDGASSIAIDTACFMRPSLVHDAFYQLMREGHLNRDEWRKTVDQELYRMCREDGMWWARAQWVYWAVRIGGRVSSVRERLECCAP